MSCVYSDSLLFIVMLGVLVTFGYIQPVRQLPPNLREGSYVGQNGRATSPTNYLEVI